jgi:maleamate amidohydrolase
MYIPDIITEKDRNAVLGKYRSDAKTKKLDIGKRPALLIVDMTVGFVTDEFRTGFSETGIPCAGNIESILGLFRRKNLPVIFTKDVSSEDMSYMIHRGAWNNKSTPVPGSDRFRHNTIFEKLNPLPGEIVIEKSKPSAFFGTTAASILNYLGATGIVVTGMVTSGCVRATVIDAFSHNYTVAVPIECVADRSQISHEVTLFDLDLKYAYVEPLKELQKIISSL